MGFLPRGDDDVVGVAVLADDEPRPALAGGRTRLAVALALLLAVDVHLAVAVGVGVDGLVLFAEGVAALLVEGLAILELDHVHGGVLAGVAHAGVIGGAASLAGLGVDLDDVDSRAQGVADVDGFVSVGSPVDEVVVFGILGVGLTSGGVVFVLADGRAAPLVGPWVAEGLGDALAGDVFGGKQFLAALVDEHEVVAGPCGRRGDVDHEVGGGVAGQCVIAVGDGHGAEFERAVGVRGEGVADGGGVVGMGFLLPCAVALVLLDGDAGDAGAAVQRGRGGQCQFRVFRAADGVLGRRRELDERSPLQACGQHVVGLALGVVEDDGVVVVPVVAVCIEVGAGQQDLEAFAAAAGADHRPVVVVGAVGEVDFVGL